MNNANKKFKISDTVPACQSLLGGLPDKQSQGS